MSRLKLVAIFGYQLNTGQNLKKNKASSAYFCIIKLMTKKTERHRKYAKLAASLSLKLPARANKLHERLVKLLADLKVVPIVILRQ